MAIHNSIISFENLEIAFQNRSDKYLKESYRLLRLFRYHRLIPVGSFLSNIAFKLKLPINPIIKKTFFPLFVGGETLQDCIPVMKKLYQQNIKSVLDYGVEGGKTEADFDKTLQEQLKAIKFAGEVEEAQIISCKITGLARFDLMAKIHAGKTLTSEESEEKKRYENRFNQISKAAAEKGVGVFFDSEETWIQQPIDDLVEEMMRKYNRERVIVYNTYQLYLKNRINSLKNITVSAIAEGYLVGAKLVRGAYMEKERARAAEKGYPSPIHYDKSSTDADYDEAVTFCIENIETVSSCVASHNEDSCALAASLLVEKNLPRNHKHLFFSQLYGMGEHITFNLAAEGFNATKYIPYGPVDKIMPYLTRRAVENSSMRGQMGRELSLLHQELLRRNLIR